MFLKIISQNVVLKDPVGWEGIILVIRTTWHLRNKFSKPKIQYLWMSIDREHIVHALWGSSLDWGIKWQIKEGFCRPAALVYTSICHTALCQLSQDGPP